MINEEASVIGNSLESMDTKTKNKIVKGEVARLLSIYTARAAIMTVQNDNLVSGQNLRDFSRYEA